MRIAIVGCGVAGMAAALAMKRRGHEAVIFERSLTPRAVGAGLLLQPTGLAALRALGLEAAIRGWGAEVSRLDGRTRQGRVVLDLPYRGEPGLGVHRGALFAVLHAAVEAEKIPVEGGAAVETLEGADGGRGALIDDRGRRFEGFDLIAIADGAHSRLRAQVAPHARAPLYPWGAFWAIVPDPDGRWADVLRQVYDGARIMIGVLPVGRAPDQPAAGACVSFFWSIKVADFAAARARGIEALKQEVAAISPECGALIEPLAAFEELAEASYRDVAARPWARGRLVVIGDAAHGTSPQLGQGANLAMIDALALADALGDADAPRPIEAALADYIRARSAHTRCYQILSRALTPVFQGDSRVISTARDLAMAWMCRAPLLGDVMHATLTGRATIGVTPWRGAWERDEPATIAESRRSAEAAR